MTFINLGIIRNKELHFKFTQPFHLIPHILQLLSSRAPLIPIHPIPLLSFLFIAPMNTGGENDLLLTIHYLLFTTLQIFKSHPMVIGATSGASAHSEGHVS